VKCRRFNALGVLRSSLGSFYTAIVRRPLGMKRPQDSTASIAAQERVASGLPPSDLANRRWERAGLKPAPTAEGRLPTDYLRLLKKSDWEQIYLR